MTVYETLRSTVLAPEHAPTGKTRHYLGPNLLVPAFALKIAKYPDDEGYYLLHFDQEGNEIADTWHASIEDAMKQAQWEFGVKKEDWKTIRAS